MLEFHILMILNYSTITNKKPANFVFFQSHMSSFKMSSEMSCMVPDDYEPTQEEIERTYLVDPRLHQNRTRLISQS